MVRWHRSSRGLLTHFAFATPDDDATDDAREHERVEDEKKTLSRQRKAFADAARVVHDRGAWFFEF